MELLAFFHTLDGQAQHQGGTVRDSGLSTRDRQCGRVCEERNQTTMKKVTFTHEVKVVSQLEPSRRLGRRWGAERVGRSTLFGCKLSR